MVGDIFIWERQQNGVEEEELIGSFQNGKQISTDGTQAWQLQKDTTVNFNWRINK